MGLFTKINFMRQKFLPLVAMAIIITIGISILRNAVPYQEEPITTKKVVPDSVAREQWIYAIDKLIQKELEIKKIIRNLQDSTDKN